MNLQVIDSQRAGFAEPHILQSLRVRRVTVALKMSSAGDAVALFTASSALEDLEVLGIEGP